MSPPSERASGPGGPSHPLPAASPRRGPPHPQTGTREEGGGAVLPRSRYEPTRSRYEPTRCIVHLDVDAFLASVEQACFPELEGKPVVVGGMPHERNLVMSCSYEARAFGVRSGMRLSEAARRCPGAIFRRGDSQAANRLRERAAFVLMRFSPLVEVASIDDFFVDLTGGVHAGGRVHARSSAFDAAVAMRAQVREATRLPVTIGIGTSKTLARLVGKLAKPGGVAEILPGGEEAFLGVLPVDALPGVGRATRALLERFAIRTVGDLRAVSREVLFASFGRLGLVLHQRARGIDPDPVEATYVEDSSGVLRPRAPVALRRDSTFEPEEGRRAIVEAMLCYLVERAAERLRAHGCATRSLEVRVTYVDTRPAPERIPARPPPGRAGEESGLPGGTLAQRRALGEPSDSTDELWRAARELYRALPRRRALVQRVGLTLEGVAPRTGWQRRLFGEPTADGDDLHGTSRDDRHRLLDRALDRLRARHGFGRILRGASLPLMETNELGPDGFRLRTPSLNQ